MDPDESLRQIRRLTRETAVDDIGYDEAVDSLNELIECVQDLDEWLGKGGFLPDAWADPTPAAEAGSSTIDLIDAAMRERGAQYPMSSTLRQRAGDTTDFGAEDGLDI